VPLPAVNPYNKDEIEYQEPGFDYAPKYPGSYDYNESGIQYREANFPYTKRDATVSVSTIACSADLSPTFAYVYTPKRPGGVAYSASYDYNKTGFDYNERDTSIPDNRVLVDYRQSGVSYRKSVDTGHTVAAIATPTTIGATTTFSASPSVPATVTLGSAINCPVTTFPTVTANTITVRSGIPATAAFPSSTISSIGVPDTVEAAAAFPAFSLYITIDAKPETIERSAELPAATASGNYTVLAETIDGTVVIGAKQMYRLVEIPTSEIVPSVGLREDATPAAYALMRHFKPGLRGDNIFIINGTTVQSFRPADLSTITRSIYGGHDSPRDLTEAEETVLVGAGYSFRVGPE